jgi:hypothetical protein
VSARTKTRGRQRTARHQCCLSTLHPVRPSSYVHRARLGFPPSSPISGRGDNRVVFPEPQKVGARRGMLGGCHAVAGTHRVSPLLGSSPTHESPSSPTTPCDSRPQRTECRAATPRTLWSGEALGAVTQCEGVPHSPGTSTALAMRRGRGTMRKVQCRCDTPPRLRGRSAVRAAGRRLPCWREHAQWCRPHYWQTQLHVAGRYTT